MEPTREELKDWAAVMAAKEFDAETANWWMQVSHLPRATEKRLPTS